MLTLLTFPGSFGAPSHSPYCVKAMCLLHISGPEWQPEYLHDPRKMPLSRLPVLRDGEQLVPDSANIQRHLEAKGIDFNKGLSATQIAQSHALVQMSEAGIYNTLVCDRWLNDESWAHESIVLKPLSDDSQYEEIVLEKDELSELKVIGEFVTILDV